MINSLIEKYNIKENYANIVDIVLCICLFVMAIYKGSFYKQDILFPNVVVTIIGVGYVAIRLFKELISKRKKVKKETIIHNLLGLIIVALPLAYLLPIIFKTYSSLSNSVYELLRYVNFCIIYYIVKKSDIQDLYLKCIVGISIVLTLFGIDQMTFRFFEPMLNNLSTGYLLGDRYRLSSTIQYANITGMIILIGYIFVCMKVQNLILKYIKDSRDTLVAKESIMLKFRNKVEICICSFVLSIQAIAIILTNSRLVILMFLIFNIALLIYHIIKKRKIVALVTFTSFATSFIFSDSVILNIATSNYVLACLYILLPAIISTLFAYIFTKYSVRNILKDFKNSILGITSKNIIITLLITILTIILSLYILAVGKPLRLNLNEKNLENNQEVKIVKIYKEIYGFKEGVNELNIDISKNITDSRYTINIIGVTDKYKEEILGSINYFDKTESKYSKQFIIGNNIKRVALRIALEKGDITFDKVELNKKVQKLSYMFLPEKTISKFRETIVGDNSNSLRYTYLLDTVKIWKQSKIFGFGGEGFKYKYQEVQSYPYVSTEAHSCLLQTLVEAGIIGFITLVMIILITIYMSLYIAKKNRNNKSFYLTFATISFLVICILDLALSFGIMIYILAILIAIISKEYSNINKGREIEGDSYFKIALLSFAIVCLMPAIYFSINIYRASLIKVDNKLELVSSVEYINSIEVLKKKISLDKYDTEYKSALINKYDEYKQALSSAYYDSRDNSQREIIKEEIINSVISMKDNTDILVNNEYSDKYVLELASKVYFNNFMTFANIYEKQFKDKELAYSFYLGYALKLTDRINNIAQYSQKSKEITKEIYSNYLKELTRQNDIIQSESISNMCDLLSLRLKKFK